MVAFPTAATCIVDSRCHLGEAPVWSAAAEALYWLDISLASEVFEWNLCTRETRRFSLNELATGLVLSSSGELIVVSETGLNVFDVARSDLHRLLSPPFSMQGMRFNDCGCLPGRPTIARSLPPIVHHCARPQAAFPMARQWMRKGICGTRDGVPVAWHASRPTAH